VSTFTDANGTKWEIKLNATLVKDIRDGLGIDIVSLDKDPFARLESDPILLVDVLFMLCEKQCKEQSLSSRDFGERISPEVLEAAIEAMLEAIINFFPPGKRSVVRSAYQANRDNLRDAEAELIQEMKSDATREAVKKANGRNIQDIIKSVILNPVLTGGSASAGHRSAT